MLKSKLDILEVFGDVSHEKNIDDPKINFDIGQLPGVFHEQLCVRGRKVPGQRPVLSPG